VQGVRQAGGENLQALPPGRCPSSQGSHGRARGAASLLLPLLLLDVQMLLCLLRQVTNIHR
jgi:hypothetical protein